MVFVNSVGFVAITVILCATMCNGKNLYDDIDTNGGLDGKDITHTHISYSLLLFFFTSPVPCSSVSFSEIVSWHKTRQWNNGLHYFNW